MPISWNFIHQLDQQMWTNLSNCLKYTLSFAWSETFRVFKKSIRQEPFPLCRILWIWVRIKMECKSYYLTISIKYNDFCKIFDKIFTFFLILVKLHLCKINKIYNVCISIERFISVWLQFVWHTVYTSTCDIIIG